MTINASSDASYPLFLPPVDISTRLPRDWTEAEARRYLVWLTSTMDQRIVRMLEFFGVPDSQDSPALLSAVGSRAMWIFRKPEFSVQQVSGSSALTDSGYALAADLGLLVARSLIRSDRRIHWKVLVRPKTELSYNQPVLAGFGRQHLDPIRGSVAEALQSIRVEDREGSWFRIFDHWLGLVKTSASSA